VSGAWVITGCFEHRRHHFCVGVVNAVVETGRESNSLEPFLQDGFQKEPWSLRYVTVCSCRAGTVSRSVGAFKSAQAALRCLRDELWRAQWVGRLSAAAPGARR
jgi:hypothetical protein